MCLVHTHASVYICIFISRKRYRKVGAAEGHPFQVEEGGNLLAAVVAPDPCPAVHLKV